MHLKPTTTMPALAAVLIAGAAVIASSPADAANEAKCRKLAHQHAPGQNPDAAKTRKHLYRLCMEKDGKL
jgi:hypothetical protein